MTTVHDSEKELKYLVSLMDKYSQIRVDPALEKIINQRLNQWPKDYQHTIYQYWKREKAIRKDLEEKLNKLRQQQEALVKKKNLPLLVKKRKKPQYHPLPTSPIIKSLPSPEPISDIKNQNTSIIKRIKKIRRVISRKPLPAKSVAQNPPHISITPIVPIVAKPSKLKWKRIVLVQSAITKKFKRV